MKRFLKMTGILIGSLLLLVALIAILFINLSPEFGGKHNAKDIKRYEQSNHFKEGKFENLSETSMDMSFSQMLSTLVDFVKGVPNAKPNFELPIEQVDSTQWEKNDTTQRIFWFGHSAFLLKLDGKNILIDPMLGDVPAPHPLLGGKRYSSNLPLEIEKLPQIDVLLISHDHYDHLDYGSVKKLKDKTKLFLVPLGIGAHLKAWGVNETQIKEFDWWQEFNHQSIHFAFTPSRHFSGRGLTDRFSTLWGGWAIRGSQHNLFFSGDSGYGTHFKEIGQKYGPFDFSMIECGQYNEKWADIHMMPEESVQAALDINSKTAMPIHWGAFTLALHSWTDPVERFTKEARRLKVAYCIPKIGEEILLSSETPTINEWWAKD